MESNVNISKRIQVKYLFSIKMKSLLGTQLIFGLEKNRTGTEEKLHRHPQKILPHQHLKPSLPTLLINSSFLQVISWPIASQLHWVHGGRLPRCHIRPSLPGRTLKFWGCSTEQLQLAGLQLLGQAAVGRSIRTPTSIHRNRVRTDTNDYGDLVQLYLQRLCMTWVQWCQKVCGTAVMGVFITSPILHWIELRWLMLGGYLVCTRLP